MARKTSPPSIRETAFECPHCGAFTTQYWFKMYARKFDDERPLPLIPDETWLELIHQELVRGEKEIPSKTETLLDWYANMNSGLVFLGERDDSYPELNVHNLYASKCYHCKKIAVWVHDNIVFPHERQGVQPNQDLPEDIVKDF